MPEAIARLTTAAGPPHLAVIADADHQYTGCHDALAGRIVSWLGRLEGSIERAK
jgi:hypothetical protein